MHLHLPGFDPQSCSQGFASTQLTWTQAFHDGLSKMGIEDGHHPPLSRVAQVECLGEQDRLLGAVGRLDVSRQLGALAPIPLDNGGHRIGADEIGFTRLNIDTGQTPLFTLEFTDLGLQFSPIPPRVEADGQADGQHPPTHEASACRTAARPAHTTRPVQPGLRVQRLGMEAPGTRV